MYLYNLSNIYKIMKAICLLIIIFKMVCVDKYSFKKIVLYFLILLVSFYNSIRIGSDIVFLTLLFILAAENVDFSKFVRIDFTIRALLVAFIIILCLLNFLPNFTKMINGSFKQAFGFTHPNILGTNVIILMLENMYLNKKITFKYVFINILVIAFLSFFCNARTSIYTYFLIILLDILIKDKEKIFNIKLLRKVLCVLPIIMLISSMLLIKEYNKHNNIVIELDKVFTTRISWGSFFYNSYGIKLFGAKIETIGTRQALTLGKQSQIFDMGFLRLAVNNGIFTCLIFTVLLCVYQQRIYKSKNYKLLLINVFFIILGLLENNMYNISYNFALIGFMNIKNNKITVNKKDVKKYE